MQNEFIQFCITEAQLSLSKDNVSGAQCTTNLFNFAFPKRNLTYPKTKEMGSQVTPKAHFTIMKLKRYF